MRNQAEMWAPEPAVASEDATVLSGPMVPEVSGVLLRALAEALLHFGVQPATLLQEVKGIEPMDVRVPLPEFRAMLSRAIQETGEPALGLRCGLHVSTAAFDLLAPLVAHAQTLRDAIRETRQFQALAFDGAFVHLSERAGTARLRCEFPRSHGATDRTLAEFLVAGLYRMLRGFGCSRSELHAACFEHRRPPNHHAYTDAFHGKELFAQSFTGVDFAADLVDPPNLHANSILQTVLRTEAEQRLERLTRPASLVERLKLFLLNQPASCVPEMGAAARELGVSVRSLRRRLVEAGLSYRALTRELQTERACRMLRNPDYTLQQVADALGFADAAGFHRAFRRWTGLTACEYRRIEFGAAVGRTGNQMAGSLEPSVATVSVQGRSAAR